MELAKPESIESNALPIQTANLVFGLTIFLSAFLLFQIEPLISKFILPWFGGGPAVWTSAMQFFQLILLVGYAYAHLLSRWDIARQRSVHLIVSLIVLIWMVLMAFRWDTPVTPGVQWKPVPTATPVGQVLLVLLVSVGLPFFLLSTTSSLIQSWFSQVRRHSSPYSFYALSNGASLLALLSYPILFEPYLTVKQQATFWSVGFGLYLLVLGTCMWITRTASAARETQTITGEEEAEPAAKVVAPGRRSYAFWISLSACASVMLLASTNYMCRDVASVPFLWVLPLSLYLLSFVITFHDHQKRLRSLYAVLTLAAIVLGLWNLAMGTRMSIFFQIGSNSLMLFSISLLCHSELYLHRPAPRYLTSFYLMLSVGGALGGILVNLVAPLIFPDFWEYNLGLIYCAIIVIVIAYQSRGTLLYRLRVPVAVLALALSVFIFALPIAWLQNSVEIARNFYGVVKIRQMQGDIPGYEMIHGAITHGQQASREPEKSLPNLYYGKSSGVYYAITNYPPYLNGQPVKIGGIGLGVGTITSYGRQGDLIKFYEIDPAVIQYAADTRYFTYLAESRSELAIVLGDGRLSLEREMAQNQPQDFDIFVIDAFSGDSVPSHLISIEAIQLYLDHLKPDGVLAFHITNRHIDLEPVLALAAEQLNIPGAIIMQDTPIGPLSSSSTWVLLTRNQALLHSPEVDEIKRDLQKKPGVRMWTDDFGNLFQVLR